MINCLLFEKTTKLGDAGGSAGAGGSVRGEDGSELLGTAVSPGDRYRIDAAVSGGSHVGGRVANEDGFGLGDGYSRVRGIAGARCCTRFCRAATATQQLQNVFHYLRRRLQRPAGTVPDL